MSGDWIKMRPSLLTSPKVNGIARFLERNESVTEVLSTGFHGRMTEIVTRNVMRNVTVASLLIVWGAANEHTEDGIFINADLTDIDDMVGIPGFGAAMESVGWLEFDDEKFVVILPNFNEYNTCGGNRSANAQDGAHRQKKYRERKRLQNSDVTSDVTSDHREEKRREDKQPPTPKGEKSVDANFAEFWKSYPNKTGKGAAEKAWQKIQSPANTLLEIIAALSWQSKSVKWTKDGGQFIPNPATYLNSRGWEDSPVGQENTSGMTKEEKTAAWMMKMSGIAA